MNGKVTATNMVPVNVLREIISDNIRRKFDILEVYSFVRKLTHRLFVFVSCKLNKQ